ncbi:receptor-type tyrosine-protein phosphatase eta-like isoform X3 [Siniperca chuatsi]|uniref:receptor-type tyrosine-protein phosphatase eta-like isoform X3 n=1 Tax=Siniperca chuatsi TaxID=119488 RepID=UPI001CE1F898|nr:receptor-type tyrosine-protein phosphatase eta-like isoform X3 [Siniperca chuatsi]
MNISQAECANNECDSNQTETLTTTTTNIMIGSRPNCTLSIGNNTSGIGSINGLIPGTVYQIVLNCLNCCKEATTKPEVVRNLTVTGFTTSSVSLNWTEPEGKSSFYSVQWTDGEKMKTVNVSQTFKTIDNLTAGVQYNVTVTAVADDGRTEGAKAAVSLYTKPEVVRNLTVTGFTTSSVSLNWTEPEGKSSFYSVQWTDGEKMKTVNVSQTFKTIDNLTAGVQYNVTVTAVADDGRTEGAKAAVSLYTKPDVVRNLTVTGFTTSSVSLNWTEPEGKSSFYSVQWTDGEIKKTVNVSQTFKTIYNLTAGVKYNITVTAVSDDGRTEGAKAAVSLYTKPEVVRNLTVTGFTTSSVSLNWTEPEGKSSFYSVQWTDGEKMKTVNVSQTFKTIDNLTAGVKYNITVTAVADDDRTEGESTTVSQYTKPAVVRNLSVTEVTTSSVSLKWTKPEGNATSYTVQWASGRGTFENTTTETSFTIKDLIPGFQYNITVAAVSVKQSNKGEGTLITTFTIPTPPGPIIISQRTNSSLHLIWATPDLMAGAPNISYHITYQPMGGKVQNKTSSVNNTELSSLSSGTSYNITVETVGPQNLRSVAVHNSTFTLPNAVTNLTVGVVNTTAIQLTWLRPNDYKPSYSYQVIALRNAGVKKESTKTEAYTFCDLVPGGFYTFNVFTVVEGVTSTVESTSSYTIPNPPGPIMVEFQSVQSINFTWPFPEDMDQNQCNFSVSSFKGSIVIENNWFLLDNLQSGSPYNISVVTVSVGNYKSTEVTAENYTRPYNVTMLRQAQITTNTVTLVWEQLESKSHYSYLLQASNGSFVLSKEVFKTTTSTISGLLSGSNYSFTVTTQTADGTLAAPVTVSYFTRPYSIRWSKAETLNTTAVYLVWKKPLEYKNEYTYTVETTGCGSQNKTLAGEETQISELTPGTNCTFCVFVRAADGIEGQKNCTSLYTKPETVQPSISSQGSNSSVLVSWTTPPGKVEYYKVYLNSTSTASELNSTNTYCLFKNLSAGRLYSAVVTTYSGPFNASSGLITNATFPNPPGPIEILTKTTSSINIRWKEAPLMTGASFHYQLTFTSHLGGTYITTTNTSQTFASLLSGTSYNISVATVGAMDFESEKVQIHMVTTRPFSVKYLNISTEEENITVKWDKPDEYKESYRYNLTWQSLNGSINNAITEETEYNIEDLVPGSHYNISVTTKTSDGTQGAPSWMSSCTNASPVKNIQCTGPNTTDAEIILSWTKPTGNYSDFQFTVINDDKFIHLSSSSTCCGHNVSYLRHYTEYNLTVKTQSCGHSSTPVSLLCSTGITNPPIPDNYQSLVVVNKLLYNRFSLHIDSSLLNNTNGPITHVGVLVKRDLFDGTSNLTNYLENTYDLWKAGATNVYLATVTKNTFQSRSGENHLSIEVGDETKWEGYTNGALEASGKYQYGIVLFTSLVLQNNLVNGQKSLVSITSVFSVIELPNNPAYAGIAIGATLGIFCVLFIILISFIIYWKRLSNKESPDIQIQSMRAKVSVAVRVEDYEAYYRKQKADSNCGFAEEFEDLKLVGTGQSKTHALTVENKPKNRYNNVLPYDSSRVKLSIIHGSPYDDYINANYMPGYNSRKEFIAAQGPLPTTVNEFWRMIWEMNVQTLVMLTRCNEQGRVKCEQYWNSGTKRFDNITVTTTSDIPFEDWTIRDFDIKNVKTAETRSVRHFHFTAWPDHGVPETTELLISFRHLVREHMNQYSRHSPTVVHCSAGVGRTGTFITIDHLIFQIERENIVDVYGIVYDLRMHRPLMVQTEDQYVFLNQCSMDIIRSRTGTNVDLIYQNTAALSIYENVEPKKGYPKRN